MQRLVAAAREGASHCEENVQLWVEQATRSMERGEDAPELGVRVAFVTVCLRRGWQLAWALPVNCVLLWKYRAHVRIYVTVVEDTEGTTLAWLSYHCKAAVTSGLLVVGVGSGSTLWHASIMKNAAHVFALQQEGFTGGAGGSAPLVVVNLDADNIAGIDFVESVRSAFEGFETEVVVAMWSGAASGTAGRIGCWARDWVRLRGYDRLLLPSGYQDMDLRDRLVAVQVIERGQRHLRRFTRISQAGTAIPNNLENRRVSLNAEKIRFCDPNLRLTWGQMNNRNAEVSREKTRRGELVRNGDSSFEMLGHPVRVVPLGSSAAVAGGSAPQQSADVATPKKRQRWHGGPTSPRVGVCLLTLGVELLAVSHWRSESAQRLARLAKGKGRGRGLGPEVPLDVVASALAECGAVDSAENVIVLDCRGFADPERQRSAVNHIGLFPQHVASFVAHPEFPHFIRAAKRAILAALGLGGPFTIACFCKKGRHRSVAAALVIRTCLRERTEVDILSLDHLAAEFWCRGTCDCCSVCRAEDPVRSAALQQAVQAWEAA